MSSTDKLITSLKERAKELRCLYEVEKVLTGIDRPLQEVMSEVVDVIGPGWQFPEVCQVEVVLDGEVFRSSGFVESTCMLKTEIQVQKEEVGHLRVLYVEDCPPGDEGPFLKEEVELIKSLADRLGHFMLFKKLQFMGKKWRQLSEMGDTEDQGNWRVVVDLLRETDDQLFVRISRKMLNFLCSIGIDEAQVMLGDLDQGYDPLETGTGERNVPEKVRPVDTGLLVRGEPFNLAARFITAGEIIFYVQKWIQEDKASLFLNVLDSPGSTLVEIQEALRRFQQVSRGDSLSLSTRKSLRVSLTQRLLTEQLEFVQMAKDQVGVPFFGDLMDRIIMPTDSHGKLGGKAAGMLLAHCILQNQVTADTPDGVSVAEGLSDREKALLGDIRVPRTWHIASDAILNFIFYNDLEEVLHQKYKPINEVRRDYPNIIRLFKNSAFPPSLVHGLSAALDDFDGAPIVIRSSSLLEDRVGTAFSGKYKSLFLANQGSKQVCLAALLDAVAEIYASMFGPDPIEYRAERGVLEFDEQMGILIQEVVGKRAGKYYFPAFAGVIFSNNEFRWSPRIEREDGLVRLVPGLGTRAVDRTGDDYPVLVVPGKPELRVNVAVDEIVRYSPSRMDLINLEANAFETVEIADLLAEVGDEYAGQRLIFSILQDGRLVKPVSLLDEPGSIRMIPTFDELRQDGRFLPQIKGLLRVLEDTLKTPVDVEFAHDGTNLYLLQCRPQSQGSLVASAPIPRDIPGEDIVFTARKFVSNSAVGEITYLVYVDPEAYGALATAQQMKSVGRAVGRLNKILPKKQFLLMGPGRWGSRGDIKLGVSVTYADINNTAMLIEIARRKGNYVPDVSFGTHFFQDLVEANIGYLPLYPDDEGVTLAERFLLRSENALADLLPEFAELASVIRVIDVNQATDGRVVRVLLNADLDEAVACFTVPGSIPESVMTPDSEQVGAPVQYWRWRREMAERIALEMPHDQWGVVGVYVYGSVKNATAGPASDIDLLIHFRGDGEQRAALMTWLDGWSRCLAEVNYLKTGYRSDGLLDVHLLTDQDLENRTSYAVKIGAVTDAAYALPLA